MSYAWNTDFDIRNNTFPCKSVKKNLVHKNYLSDCHSNQIALQRTMQKRKCFREICSITPSGIAMVSSRQARSERKIIDGRVKRAASLCLVDWEQISNEEVADKKVSPTGGSQGESGSQRASKRWATRRTEVNTETRTVIWNVMALALPMVVTIECEEGLKEDGKENGAKGASESQGEPSIKRERHFPQIVEAV